MSQRVSEGYVKSVAQFNLHDIATLVGNLDAESTIAMAQDLRDTRDAARKALAVLRKDSTSYAWCVHCKRRQGLHAPKCALAEAISDLEKVL